MEDPNPTQTLTPPPPPSELPVPNLNPPNTAQNLPPQPPPPPPAPPTLPQESKKRPLDQNGHTHHSKHFKIRAVVKDLRPHFIEVLRTPVFHNCKAANEIREQMKVLMSLYREMTSETISIGKRENMPESDQDVKPTVFVKAASEEKPPVLSENLSEKQTPQGTYIVGGSAFGWNFITYNSLGNKAVYYGRTKEVFRSANVIPPQ
ncbi:hypothetical protein RHMOL_Rhmol07G0019200 [Rhododendron molle]|uniref:Uncharacterized protein n=1 Tax=Rhododendron molle TaxID=49168 RepID=A0ACC0MX26_RHOML|nr:hypothetical protein RHMOL_Rhmol07G0019200 [Rhododendron molle]